MFILSRPHIFACCHNAPLLMTECGKSNKICQISVKNFDHEKLVDQMQAEPKFLQNCHIKRYHITRICMLPATAYVC